MLKRFVVGRDEREGVTLAFLQLDFKVKCAIHFRCELRCE